MLFDYVLWLFAAIHILIPCSGRSLLAYIKGTFDLCCNSFGRIEVFYSDLYIYIYGYIYREREPKILSLDPKKRGWITPLSCFNKYKYSVGYVYFVLTLKVGSDCNSNIKFQWRQEWI